MGGKAEDISECLRYLEQAFPEFLDEIWKRFCYLNNG